MGIDLLCFPDDSHLRIEVHGNVQCYIISENVLCIMVGLVSRINYN